LKTELISVQHCPDLAKKRIGYEGGFTWGKNDIFKKPVIKNKDDCTSQQYGNK
jgi:hypothetical protein